MKRPTQRRRASHGHTSPHTVWAPSPPPPRVVLANLISKIVRGQDLAHPASLAHPPSPSPPRSMEPESLRGQDACCQYMHTAWQLMPVRAIPLHATYKCLEVSLFPRHRSHSSGGAGQSQVSEKQTLRGGGSFWADSQTLPIFW
jgi:hypothetical protein